MRHIQLDRAAQAELCGVGESAELRDESGRLIGYFVPAPDPALYAEQRSPLSEDELRSRAEAAKRGKCKTYSTQEVLRRLETLQ